jgi:hypothetical protein
MLSRVTLIYPSFLGAPTETHGNLVYKLIIKLCARDMAAGSHGPAESLSKGAYLAGSVAHFAPPESDEPIEKSRVASGRTFPVSGIA